MSFPDIYTDALYVLNDNQNPTAVLCSGDKGFCGSYPAYALKHRDHTHEAYQGDAACYRHADRALQLKIDNLRGTK